MGYHGDRHGEATTEQQAHSWAVYHIKGTPAKLVGIIEAPDEQTAIARAMADAKRAATLGRFGSPYARSVRHFGRLLSRMIRRSNTRDRTPARGIAGRKTVARIQIHDVV